MITDAIEGCFAFNLNPEDYQFKETLSKDISLSDAVTEALEMEETMLRFYQVAAEQSKHLMADVPRNFFNGSQKENRKDTEVKVPFRKEDIERAK